MKAFTILYTIAAVMPLTAFAECVEPAPPGEPPSGATASRAEMVAAQAAIKGYDAAVVKYTECVKRDGGNSIRADETVRAVERLAALFNAELRVFKQRNGG